MNPDKDVLGCIFDLPFMDVNLYFIGDFHEGSVASQRMHPQQQKVINIIAKDPIARVIGMGDLIEAIAPIDKRWDPSQLAKPISEEHLRNPFYCEAKRFAKMWEPTKGKWLVLIDGNHEGVAGKTHYCNPTSIIADHLGARCVGGSAQSAWIMLRFHAKGDSPARWKNGGRGVVRIYIQHGWSAGEMRGADALCLQRMLWKKRADVVAMAHTHRSMIMPETVEMMTSKGRIITDQRMGVISYAMIHKHGYLARKAGNCPPMGYAVVNVHIDRCTTFPHIRATLVQMETDGGDH